MGGILGMIIFAVGIYLLVGVVMFGRCLRKIDDRCCQFCNDLIHNPRVRLRLIVGSALLWPFAVVSVVAKNMKEK